MNLAADMGRHSGRAKPSLLDAPYRQFDPETGRRSTYPMPIPVQTYPATSLRPARTSDVPIVVGNGSPQHPPIEPGTIGDLAETKAW